jgi:hypothetical protein
LFGFPAPRPAVHVQSVGWAGTHAWIEGEDVLES